MAEVVLNKENFAQEAEQSKSRVLIDFWASWCGPCRMQTPVLEQFAAEHPEIKVGTVNVDEEPELANRFGVMSIPTLLVLENGEVKATAVGVQSQQALEELIHS